MANHRRRPHQREIPTIAGGRNPELRYYRERGGAYACLELNSLRWGNFVIEPGDSRNLGG